jgi:hypothetical protein
MLNEVTSIIEEPALAISMHNKQAEQYFSRLKTRTNSDTEKLKSNLPLGVITVVNASKLLYCEAP